MYHKKPQNWKKHSDFMLLDVLCLHIAFILAYMTRHGWYLPYHDKNYVNIILVYTLVDVVVLIINNTLKSVLKRGHYLELANTAKHVFFVELIIAFYLFSMQEGEAYSRIAIYLTAVYYFLLTFLVREMWKQVLRKKFKNGISAIFFVTTSRRAEDTVRNFLVHNPGYLIQGICVLDEDRAGQTVAGIPVVVNRSELLTYLCDKWIDEVYFSVSSQYPYPEELITGLADMGIVVHVEMEYTVGAQEYQQIIEKMGNRMVRSIGITMANTQQLLLKRCLDILGGLVGCIITGLLVLIIGPMIYIKSPGPIFFTQTRVGKNGKLFKMYKFRSMYLDAEARKAELMRENRIKDGMMFKLEFDPRIIGCEKLPDGTIKKGIGNFIRDYSLDEFPQFLNVLKGDLSLCGTRPPTVDEWNKYELHHRARLAIKPGITGLWQVSGRSNITNFDDVVELDKKYIREWSMGLDFRILLQTIKVVLGKEGSM